MFFFTAIVVLPPLRVLFSSRKSPLSYYSYCVVEVVKNRFLRKLLLYRPPYRGLLRKIKISTTLTTSSITLRKDK
nr:MAG TPA: hypothetical protein [Caudoviricetes sp.]DAQ61697.1 MAG TPA: hypothetical protein [Caudoviricetes sp.]